MCYKSSTSLVRKMREKRMTCILLCLRACQRLSTRCNKSSFPSSAPKVSRVLWGLFSLL